MDRLETGLKVAIVGTNNDKMYSGGRYHGLIIAYALATRGVDVTVVTNKKPKFMPDLEPIAPGKVNYSFTGDFRSGMPSGPFDYVVMVPTGIFLPDFYEATMNFARRSEARLALINFEAGNFFNQVAPEPRDIRLWDYWQRSVAEGGIVISSLQESDRYARDFYQSINPRSLRFEICAPPINSRAAEPSRSLPKDKAVLTFVRSSDGHKGGADLLALDPKIFAGHEIRVVSGGAIDPDFKAQLDSRFGSRSDITMSYHTAISDAEKFRLIGTSKAVLFPSHFEGFGYPPVEAVYMGTEVAAYDLPVVRETVGKVAHLAPTGDIKALGKQLAAALAAPERREELHNSVRELVRLEDVGNRLGDILLRGLDGVPPLPPRTYDIAWGPFPQDAPDPKRLAGPPIPPVVLGATETPAGDTLFSVLLPTDHDRIGIRTQTKGVSISEVHLSLFDQKGPQRVVQATMLVSGLSRGVVLDLEVTTERGRLLGRYPLRIDRLDGGRVPPLSLLSFTRERGQSTLLLRPAPELGADTIAATADGSAWHVVPVSGPTTELKLPVSDAHRSGLTVYLYRNRVPVAAYGGLPLFATARRTAGIVDAESFAEFDLVPLNISDAHWDKGMLRGIVGQSFGALAFQMSDKTEQLRPGDLMRLGSGRLRRIAEVRRKPPVVDVLFTQGVNPETDGYPNAAWRIPPEGLDLSTEALRITDGDPSWHEGVWRGQTTPGLQCFVVPYRFLAGCRDHLDAVALLDGEGRVHEVERLFDLGRGLLMWVSSPAGSGRLSLKSLKPIRSARGVSLVATGAEGWQNGVSADGHTVRLAADAPVGTGTALVFAHSGLRRITAITKTGEGIEATLGLAVDPELDGAPHPLRHPTPHEAFFQDKSALRLSGTVTTGNPPSVATLVNEYRNSENRTRLPARLSADRPRVMFLSIVPPVPSDQGNRIVTRNFIAHLIAQGFDVDLVLIGDLPSTSVTREFGDRVRVFNWFFPNWFDDPTAKQRRAIVEGLRGNMNCAGFEKEIFDTLYRSANIFHPYYIVPDAYVQMAMDLYRRHAYHSIVCNYTHMIRVAKELEAIRPLPPVTVVTHDSLSRLPLQYNGQWLDTMYRFCTPEIERDVLNAVDGAMILAISESEQRYFAEIGVTNPIALCEYDGLSECRRYSVRSGAFRNSRIIFHASANPMNVVAIDWFVRECWPTIRAAVPDARLVVCGSIKKAWQTSAEGVDIRGPLDRRDLMEEISRSTIAINPTVAGTGLKIKTVEAACAGLPSVCLPPAVEGLEKVADQFCVLASDAPGFIAGCIDLLTDASAWETMHRKCMEFSAQRFSEAAIYGPVDTFMGWDKDVEARFAAPRQPYAPIAATGEIDLTGLPEKKSRKVRVALELAELEEVSMAWSFLADAAVSEVADRNRLSLVAARMGLKVGNLSAAFDLVARVLGEEPDNVQALAILVDCALATNNPRLCYEALHQLALSAPMAPSITRAQDGAAIRIDKSLAAWQRRPIEVPVGQPFSLAGHVPEGEIAGFGWSGTEGWGAWTDSAYARLDFTFAKPQPGPLRLRMQTRADASCALGDQKVRVFADNGFAGLFMVRRQEDSSLIEFELPAAATPRGTLALDFFISDPAPVRNAAGDYVDQRPLGIAMQRITIDPVK